MRQQRVVLGVERLEALVEDFLASREREREREFELRTRLRTCTAVLTAVSSGLCDSGSPVMSSLPGTLGGLKEI